jgi:hypothetical protein
MPVTYNSGTQRTRISGDTSVLDEPGILIETPSDTRQPFPHIYLILSLIRLYRDLAGK